MSKIDLEHIGLLVLVSGLSGAGKSVATDTLSDLGFYTVENLPVPLFPSFIEFTRRNPTRFARTALSLDIDSREKQELLRQMLKDCDEKDNKLKLVFLDCKPETIIKRYGQTRRPHPGFDPNRDRTLEDAIRREIKHLFGIRELSNLVIDTTELNVHELRREMRNFIEAHDKNPHKLMRVNFLSFGFKHGLPIDCDLVVDARFLPNPYFVEELQNKTGEDQGVIDYVLRFEQARSFLQRYIDLLCFLLPEYTNGGKSYLNVGIGCTGGRHRSVVISNQLSKALQERMGTKGYIISAKHRDLDKPN